MNNLQQETVEGFGLEWRRYDQASLSGEEREALFEQYFRIFPWHILPKDAQGFDLGCGSGRWARCVAPRVGRLHCVDASADALMVAEKNLKDVANVELHCASVDSMPLNDRTMDFGYSLGVLHHVPDTGEGIRACVAKLKPGAPFLVYLYYAFDNRPIWYRGIWRLSDVLRRVISKLPFRSKDWLCTLIAFCVYLPLATTVRVLERIGLPKRLVHVLPLAAYRDKSFYTMRTDSLDRFGTRLEQRFSADEIRGMMEGAGLEDIAFSPSEPFWCAVGYKSTKAALSDQDVFSACSSSVEVRTGLGTKGKPAVGSFRR